MTDNTQTEALLPSRETLMAQAQVFASAWAIAGSRFDSGDGMEVAEQEKAILADMTRRLHARIAELEAHLASIRADGVSGPLMGQPQAMPDLSQLTERGAVAWAVVDAQGLRDGGASPSANAGEPVAWLSTDCIGERYLCFTKPKDSNPARPLVFGDTTPHPTQAQAGAPLSEESLGVRSKAVLIANAIESANNHDDLAIAADDAPAMIRTLLALVDLRERQPTQAQAGAVPLTDAQIRAMLNKHPPEDVCGWSYRMGIDDAELHHGIKGGQHGTE